MSKMSNHAANLADADQFRRPCSEPPEPDGPILENDAGPFTIGVCVRLVDLWKSDPEACGGPVRELVTQAPNNLRGGLEVGA
jgi:hypothetical protein